MALCYSPTVNRFDFLILHLFFSFQFTSIERVFFFVLVVLVMGNDVSVEDRLYELKVF